MALLQVRDFPQDLYDRLAQAARAERRSIAGQTSVLLREALATTESTTARRQRAVDAALGLAQATPQNGLDPVGLIREDRERR